MKLVFRDLTCLVKPNLKAILKYLINNQIITQLLLSASEFKRSMSISIRQS